MEEQKIVKAHNAGNVPPAPSTVLEPQHMNGKCLPAQMKKEMERGIRSKKNKTKQNKHWVIYFTILCSGKSPKLGNETES